MEAGFMRFLVFLLFTSAAFAQPPVIADAGVLNGASYIKGQPIAPGSIVAIFGSNLANGSAQATSLPLPTTLGEVSVTIGGVAAPLLFVSPTQINAQVPYGALPAGSVLIFADATVTNGSSVSPALQIQIAAAAPGIFSIPVGVGHAIAINADSSLAAPTGSISGIATHPAKAGDIIIIFATGLGAVTPAAATGAASQDQLRKANATPTVLVGGQPATITFAGLSPQFAGVNQINAIIPAKISGDAVPLQVQVGGISSTDQVTIAISR
jgi:uncharacterized protein (TIGR03437 family)